MRAARGPTLARRPREDARIRTPGASLIEKPIYSRYAGGRRESSSSRRLMCIRWSVSGLGYAIDADAIPAPVNEPVAYGALANSDQSEFPDRVPVWRSTDRPIRAQ